MFRLAPAPRDGEMLYSVLARLGRYLNADEAAPFMEKLVGRRGGVASPDLPGGLSLLVRDLVDEIREPAIDRIIDRLTGFPFHTAFMPASVRDSVRCAMRGDVTGVYTRLGLAAFKVRASPWLRFCPDCLCDMEAEYPDLWWRREHQLAGVPVCAVHGTVLRISGVKSGERNRHSFSAATRQVCPPHAEPVIGDVSEAELAGLTDIARAAVQLLVRPPDATEHDERRDAYRRQLYEVGLMRSAHRMDVARLHQAFRERWGRIPELVPGLEIIAKPEQSWLTAMIGARSRAMHPIKHIMLIGMLDGAVRVDLPFGPGPWLCRNPVADHVGRAVIHAVTVRHACGMTYGDFACPCGYLYSVTRAADGTLGSPRYRSFGSSFVPALIAAIDRGDGLRLAARLLGLDPKTLMREAAIAGIDLPWTTAASGRVPAVTPKIAQAARAPSPPRRARARRNWFAIDVRLARSARLSARLILAEEPPVRVTFAEVERRIARRDWVVKRGSKLPATVEAIAGAVEDVDQFRWRRLRRCVEDAVAKGDLRPCEVLRSAGLPTSWMPNVRGALVSAQSRGVVAA